MNACFISVCHFVSNSDTLSLLTEEEIFSLCHISNEKSFCLNSERKRCRVTVDVSAYVVLGLEAVCVSMFSGCAKYGYSLEGIGAAIPGYRGLQ